jgi:hypothetical protein
MDLNSSLGERDRKRERDRGGPLVVLWLGSHNFISFALVFNCLLVPNPLISNDSGIYANIMGALCHRASLIPACVSGVMA